MKTYKILINNQFIHSVEAESESEAVVKVLKDISLKVFSVGVEEEKLLQEPLYENYPMIGERVVRITDRFNKRVLSGEEDSDDHYYLFEEIMLAIYGPKYFDWYNSKSTKP